MRQKLAYFWLLVYLKQNIKHVIFDLFQLILSFWMYNGFQPGVGLASQFAIYDGYLGETDTNFTTAVLYSENVTGNSESYTQLCDKTNVACF